MKPKQKIDLYKLHQAEYAAARKPALMEVKPARYLAISARVRPAENGSPRASAHFMAWRSRSK